MSNSIIKVVNSRVHNLKNVCCEIPKNSFTVITGPSGSGKSSLVFDTIYMESQRRFIDSLSSYARYFLGQFQAPDADLIEGLSPSIAIEQKINVKNPRSTVGTLTEIYDYLRVLFAKTGTLYCPDTGAKIISHTPTQIVKEIESLGESSKIIISSPVNIINKKELLSSIEKFQSMGFLRGIMDDHIFLFEEFTYTDKIDLNTFEVVIDRIVIKEGIKQRLHESIELALRIGDGLLKVKSNEKSFLYSTKNISPKTLKIFPKVDARTFSHNSPHGACLTCKGLGLTKDFDENLLVIDPSFSIADGAIKPVNKKSSLFYNLLEDFLRSEKLKLSTPLNQFSDTQLSYLFHGHDKVFSATNSKIETKIQFPGIIPWLRKKYKESKSKTLLSQLDNFQIEKICPECHGNKLNHFALAVKLADNRITDLSKLPIKDLYDFFISYKFKSSDGPIAQPIINNIIRRCEFLMGVGLNYLNLNRPANTLSGGEMQRIRMANQLGSSLSGVLYVLDEPSIGLHPKDNQGLIDTFYRLRNNGNTVLVIEHDQETIEKADYIYDLGPNAGVHGGEITAHGNLTAIKNNNDSLTGKYLSKSLNIDIPNQRRVFKRSVKIDGANKHNINNMSVDFPLDSLVCITGVSGSGKSTLMHDILIPAIKNSLRPHSTLIKENYRAIKGLSNIKSIIQMDQSPIGRSPHSNPATFCGIFDEVRNIFAATSEAKIRGYNSGRFSFNVKGGRCEECEGNGLIKIEMHYMPDVYLICEECGGTRYNSETLSILYKTKNIADILDMTIEDASQFFKNHPKIFRKLDTLNKVGLGYLKLGQSATTLSGGEAQRLKIAKELSKKQSGHTLYVLDEPTTGLHFDDIKVLLKTLNDLIDQGNSVFIIEHNLDVIKSADYIIDLGPGGGSEGGQVIATGTPEEVSQIEQSYTGEFLKRILNG